MRVRAAAKKRIDLPVDVVLCPGRGEIAAARCLNERAGGSRAMCDKCAIYLACPDCAGPLVMDLNGKKGEQFGLWRCSGCTWEGDRLEYYQAKRVAHDLGVKTRSKQEAKPRVENSSLESIQVDPGLAVSDEELNCSSRVRAGESSSRDRMAGPGEKKVENQWKSDPWLKTLQEQQAGKSTGPAKKQKRRSGGHCGDCGAKIQLGRKRCHSCSSKLAAKTRKARLQKQQKKKREADKAKSKSKGHQCVDCGDGVTNRALRCHTCEMKRRAEMRRTDPGRAEAHGKIAEPEERRIRTEYRDGASISGLARKFNRARGTVQRIVASVTPAVGVERIEVVLRFEGKEGLRFGKRFAELLEDAMNKEDRDD